MRYFLAIALLSIYPTTTLAAELLIEETAPPGELRLLKTVSGYRDIAVYATGEAENQDSYRQGNTYLSVSGNDQIWWIHTPAPFSEIDALGFAEGPLLLVGLRSAAGAATMVLNTESRESYPLGQGIAEIIPEGPNEGLIRLTGQYAHDSDGRYWYTSVVDLSGRVIEFGTEGETCLPLSHITRHGGDFSQLRQPLDFCVGVSR